ncbi:hypothetical protein PPL_08008 [Heterostelium album PN500]|uniref:Uncharacterized protein n=1 Tax=Heterostelium pallidum (strain ATCC 26659 / Pp 5 / PN500) TaxID=670386 RepID=D3BHK5_HETP5|nr:hypothetical protein PPL_08008 [Heterostelium album PN500]EFA79182.1 hypothetical protein PPL_08008 [Heterostelium album PN500]|eukprot:XP_020431303.1 hypothetical protein PPL_08008 [Heterostelium album PN500]
MKPHNNIVGGSNTTALDYQYSSFQKINQNNKSNTTSIIINQRLQSYYIIYNNFNNKK